MRDKRQCHFRLFGIHGNGIQNTAGIVPQCVGYGIYLNVTPEIYHQVGKFLAVIPAEIKIHIGPGTGLKVNVTNYRTGRITDVHYRQHLRYAGASAVTGNVSRITVDSMIVFKTDGRGNKPVPFSLAGDILYAIALGVGLTVNTHNTAAKGNPAVFCKLILHGQVILLGLVVSPAE